MAAANALPAGPPAPSRAFVPALARHAAAAVALAFLLLGLATLADHGITWDERESYRAGSQDLRIAAAALAGRPRPPWPWHELPGYQFAAESLRAGFAAIVNRVFWEPGSHLGFHLFNLLATAVVVWLAGRLAARESGLPALGPLAALLLALHPKLIAHSQANPKDGLGLLVWLLAATAVARAARNGRARDFALLGLALGGALATHVGAVLLLPLALGWGMVGRLETRAGEAGGERVRPARWLGGLALAFALAVPTAVLLWPWLWESPLARARWVVEHVGGFDVAMRVLYLGETWDPTALPWHYGTVSLLIATPVPLVLAAGLGLVAAVAPRAADAAARLARLATLWLALVVAADLAAPAHYDGARHLLPALPALALLGAAGLAWAAARLRVARARRLAAASVAALAAALLVVAWQVAAVHPYQDAFLNLPARAWLGPEAQRRVELEYWGGSYREGAMWLRAHAPPGSLVLVPIGAHAAAPFLAGRLELVPQDAHPDDGRAQHLMLMTRRAWYTPRVREVVATREPVFTVRRQGSTLLAIYRVR